MPLCKTDVVINQDYYCLQVLIQFQDSFVCEVKTKKTRILIILSLDFQFICCCCITSGYQHKFRSGMWTTTNGSTRAPRSTTARKIIQIFFRFSEKILNQRAIFLSSFPTSLIPSYSGIHAGNYYEVYGRCSEKRWKGKMRKWHKIGLLFLVIKFSAPLG